MYRPSRNIDSHPRATHRSRQVERPAVEEKIDNSPPRQQQVQQQQQQSGNSSQTHWHTSKPQAIDPVPIGSHGMSVVPQFPIAESSILNEDTEYVDSVISLFYGRRARRRTVGDRDDESHGDELLKAIQSQHRRKRKRRPRASSIERSPTENLGDSGGDGATGESTANSSDASSVTSLNTTRSKGFRSYQTALWGERFAELQSYAKTHGSCLVPHNWKENVSLAKWVKRQRYQYKLKLEGKHSTLTPERQAALEGLGFIWDSHSAVWEERLQELRDFKQRHGHCNVPSTFSENHSLSIWVQCQRRQFKLLRRSDSGGGKRSHMSSDRIAKLNSIGFVWDPRNRDNEL